MVRSLSSDKSVWDAVQKNQAVQELRNALNAGWLSVIAYGISLKVGIFLEFIHTDYQCSSSGISTNN